MASHGKRGGGSRLGGVRRWLGASALSGLLLTNTGCITTGPVDWVRNGFKVGPNYCRPPAPVADDWSLADNPRIKERQHQDGLWWAAFQDPVLDSLVHRAYEQNLNLRVLGTRVLQARGQQAIAVGSLFPQTQQANGSYSRVNLSSNAANNPVALLSLIPGANNNSLATIPGSEIPTLYYSNWQVGFNMSWELDFWGRFRRSIEASNANLDATVENFDNALVTLVADVATNYVQYRVAQQRIKIANDNISIQESVVKLAQERFRVGTGTKLDVDQARTVLEQTRALVPTLNITLAQANDALCTLTGVPAHDLSAELGPGPEINSNPLPHTPDWVEVGVPADLIRRRPDVRSAERQVAAQSAQIGVAEADLYPSFFIDGMLGLQAQDIAKLFESNSFFGTLMPNFRWNILNYGRVLNNVRVQDARTQEQVANYQNLVLRAAQETEDALAGFVNAREQVAALTRGVDAATSATKLGIAQLNTGTADYNRFFTLATTQVQVQDQLAVAQGNVALNLINAYRAVGGGWQLRCPPPTREDAAAVRGLTPPPTVPGKSDDTALKDAFR